VSLMFRDKTSDDVLSYKFLLLGIVRLIHADPNLMLNVRTVVTTDDLRHTRFHRRLKIVTMSGQCVIYHVSVRG